MESQFQVLRQKLDAGKTLPFPDALLMNGLKDSAVFTGEAGNIFHQL